MEIYINLLKEEIHMQYKKKLILNLSSQIIILYYKQWYNENF